MKQGSMNLPGMLAELERQAQMKKDYKMPAQAIHMRDGGEYFDILSGSSISGSAISGNTVSGSAVGGSAVSSRAEEVMTLRPTQLFHRQLASAMDVPAKYYDKMREEAPELLTNTMNTWLARSNNSYMVRTMDYDDGRGQVARAFLSDRYRRIDNLEVAGSLLKLFLGMEGCEVVSNELSPSRLTLKLVFHTKTYEVKPGDIIEFGIVIMNSEVGLGAVGVYPFINRLVCSNGMVCNELGKRKHHVGRLIQADEDSYELYSDATLKAEDEVFLSKLQDVARAAMDEARYPMIVDKLKESTTAKITGAVPEVVELTAKNYGLRKQETDNVLRYLIEGGDLSLYGLSNAVTRMSQDSESYDRATDLETIGWNIATMPGEQWRSINRGRLG